MHKLFYSIVVCLSAVLALPCVSRAQQVTPDTAAQPITAPNAIFAEIGGNCLLGSINYDRRLNKNLALRIGICPVLLPAVTVIANAMTGHKATNIQFGLGVTAITPPPISTTYSEPGYGSGQNNSSFMFFATADLGFRIQPPHGGFMLQLDATPMIPLNHVSLDSSLLWGGLSLGYAF